MPPSSQSHPLAAMPMHLTLAILPWIASSAALRLSKAELQALKKATGAASPHENSKNAKGFHGLWQNLLDDRQLAKAVEAEARSRAAEFLQGLIRYQQTPYTHYHEEFSCIFSRGSARLLDCGGPEDGPRVLLVPSLINRYYILDLTQKLSLARYLSEQGMRTYLVDWGSPSAMEKHFNCGMYVSEHLAPMAEWIRRDRDELIVAGYCMGGLLALGLAATRPELVDGLACFATPWDFSVPDFPKIALPQQQMDSIRAYIADGDNLSAETIHTLFHFAHPYAFQAKLREFSRMKPGSPAIDDFLAIEHWVQDGVPMTSGVAQDCLIEWPQKNATAELQWRACGRVVDPSSLRMPVFIATPKDDRIVPSSCALPLAKLCKNATFIQPTSGHVGMIVGKNRKSALWEPFSAWVHNQAA